MTDNNRAFSRRKFLATTTTGLISAGMVGLAPARLLAQAAEEQTATPVGEIIKRPLGKTGMVVPIVSMGAGGIENPALVQAAYEAGVRLFDTAGNYAFGRNEQMVGRALDKMGIRDKVLIQTKVLTPDQRRGLSPEACRDKLLGSIDACLKRLRTNYIDILHVHDVRDAETVHNTGIHQAFRTLKEQGKIRAAGVSSHTGMTDVIRAALAHKDVYDVVLTSLNFTLADDSDLLKAIAEAKAAGIGIVAMKTQAGGARWPNPDSLRNYTTETINVACLRWVVNNENITTTVPGFSNYEQLEQDFAVAHDLAYKDDEAKFLKDNSIVLGMGFCRQCRKCLASCPKGAEIPDLMRIHMYAKQYGDFRLARHTLDDIPRERSFDLCSNCSECSAACANSVDIPARISELKLIYA